MVQCICRLLPLVKLVNKEVKKIIDKADLTSTEMESLYKAACFMEKVEKTCSMEESASYGYEREPWVGYSEMRGRTSPVTGRYISRGMSGHSIEDRMIAALEQQMDNAKTEYERQQIMEEINHIRMGTR